MHSMEQVNRCLSFFGKELYLIFQLTFPVYLSSLCLLFVFLITLIYIGHIENGKTALAAVNLCYAITNATGWILNLSLSSSLDTLASQAHGAADYKRLGILLQRSVLIHLFLFTPIAIIWLNIENILIILNQQPELVVLAGQYMNVYIFIIPAFTIIFPFMKILQMQDIVLPSTIILVCGVGLEIALSYLLVFVMDLGIRGAALGQVLAMYSIAAAQLVYLRVSSVWKRIWGGWSWEAWDKWGQYFYYGVPVLITNLNEILAIQIGGFVVGIVSDQPKVQISVYSIMSYLDFFTYMLPLSLSTVSSIRIGNLIGEGDIARVKKVGALHVTTQVVLSIFQSVVLFGGRSVWGGVFSSDPNVVRGVKDLIFILAIYHPFDSLVSVFQGVLRGSGKQDLGLIMAFVFAAIAFPLAIGLSIGVRLVTLGYLLGIMAGYLVRALVCLFVALCCIKWNAFRRVDSEQVQENNLTESLTDQMFRSYQSISSHPIQTNNSINNSNSRNQTGVKFSFSNFRYTFAVKKVVLSLVLFAILILMLACKFGSSKLSIYVEGSYLQQPLEICCFSYIPFRNISHS